MDRISTAFDSYFLHSYTILSTATGPRSSTLTPEKLAQRWGIGLETAKNTLRVTTQKGICSTMYPVERRFHTRQAQLRYKQFSGIHGKFYTNTFISCTPSLQGNKMAQMHINDVQFCKVYPMKIKSVTSDNLSAFIHEVGILSTIHSNDAKEWKDDLRNSAKNISSPQLQQSHIAHGKTELRET
jgi:hypothetical protein